MHFYFCFVLKVCFFGAGCVYSVLICGVFRLFGYNMWLQAEANVPRWLCCCSLVIG